MVVAAIVGLGECPLTVNGATKLPAANHHRIFQHSTLFQIKHKARRGLVNILTLHSKVFGKRAMLVPALVEELDKANASFRHPPCQKAIVGETARLLGVRPVQAGDVILFARQIHQVGHGRLHSIGHLILGNARLGFGIGKAVKSSLIKRCQGVELFPSCGRIDPIGIGKIKDRVAARAELNPLMLGREKATTPKPCIKRLLLTAALRDHHGKRREVFVVGAQPIGKPSPHAGAAGLLRPSGDVGNGGVVVDRFGMNGFHQTNIIHNRGGVRQKFRVYPSLVFAIFGELEHRGDARKVFLAAGHTRDALAVSDRIGQFGAMEFVHLGLVIEHINVAWATREKEIDDPLCLALKMKRGGGQVRTNGPRS